ncbi:MAG TPA: trypsin-like peptidase domain-containing protein [Croceibacterium sp.]
MLRRFIRLLSCWLAVSALLLPAPSLAAGFDYRRVSNSVVYVAVFDSAGEQIGHGSGFIVAPGVVVTNFHVASAGPQLAVVPNGDDGSKLVRARIRLMSKVHDLAILDAPGIEGRAVPIAVGAPAMGVPVWAVGFPGLADIVNVESRVSASLTTGTVSRFFAGRTGFADGEHPTDLVQHSAQIAQGNSGGPLFDQCQRVVGVNTQLATREGSTFLYSVASTELVPLLREAGVSARFSSAGCGDTPAANAPEPDTGIASEEAPVAEVLPDTPPADAPSEVEADQIQEEARDQAMAQARAARSREAAAIRAQQRAVAANDTAEAARQAKIAADSRAAAEQLEEYSRKLDQQLQEAVDPIERYLPIGLGGLAFAAFAGLLWWLSRHRAAVYARRRKAAAELSEREQIIVSQSNREILLRGDEVSFKLPGPDLENGVIVGRSVERADVVIPHDSVGRQHARFVRQGGRVFVCDLSSQNGVFVNGRRIAPQREEQLRSGDTIGLGPNLTFTCEFS